MRTLVLATVGLAALLVPAPAAAGGCDVPTVAVIDVSPPRAAIPANGDWDAATLAAQDRWRADLRARLATDDGVSHVAWTRDLTASERRSLARLVHAGAKARVPARAGDFRYRPGPDRAVRRIDTLVVVHIPRDLLAATTVAVVGLHERRLVAMFHGPYLAMTPGLVEPIVELASMTMCSI